MAEKKERTPEERQLAIEKASDNLEQIVAECGVAALAQIQSPLMQSIRLADGMSRMRELMTRHVVEKYFMPLQGTPLGFVTDKDRDGGYPWEVVRDVTVEALMRGFRPIGNEFNILAGRFYGARQGFQRIVHEFPGVRDVQYDLGVPHMVADKGALVAFYARWVMSDGEVHELRGTPATDDNPIDTRIAVKVNSGMGPDAILGKATRKMYARIYQRLTGCSRDIVEMDPADYVDAKASGPVVEAQEGRRMSLKAKSEPKNEAPAEPVNERAAANPDDPDSYG